METGNARLNQYFWWFLWPVLHELAGYELSGVRAPLKGKGQEIYLMTDWTPINFFGKVP